VEEAKQEEMLTEETKLELSSRMTEYGDIFFEDLAQVMFTSVRKRKAIPRASSSPGEFTSNLPSIVDYQGLFREIACNRSEEAGTRASLEHGVGQPWQCPAEASDHESWKRGGDPLRHVEGRLSACAAAVTSQAIRRC
jgi:hypothetical protein